MFGSRWISSRADFVSTARAMSQRRSLALGALAGLGAFGATSFVQPAVPEVPRLPRAAGATGATGPSSSSFGAALGALGLASAVALPARPRRLVRAAEPSQPAPGREPEIDPRRSDPPGTVPPVRMPMVDTGSGEKIDVMSKLLQDRIIILGGEVKDEMAQVLVAQMLYLANTDPNQDITMYINSPGGSVSAGMAIYDTMQFIPCDVSTVCFGMAASMGSFLLAAGTKGKRKSLPNSRIMIHQPLGGAQGQALDVRIQAREILHMREILNMHLADATGQPIEQIAKDCDRDNFMTPEEAKAYGLIDDITPTKAWPRIQKPKRPEL